MAFRCKCATRGPTPSEVQAEYGLSLVEQPDGPYDGIVLAVGHQQFADLDWTMLRGKQTAVYDVKSFLDKSHHRRAIVTPTTMKEKVLITGAAGFIGFHLTRKLSAMGYRVVGIDNLNDYYDVRLKEARLARLQEIDGFTFHKMDLEEKERIDTLFAEQRFDYAVNLAAQAGVRYSLENPYAYINANVTGFLNILEACRHHPVKHLVYASSSSVYGANTQMPFSTASHRRSPGIALRRHQEVERTDGPYLRPPVRRAEHRAALLHGVRSLRSARHGPVLCLPRRSWMASRSTYSTTAKCAATLRT